MLTRTRKDCPAGGRPGAGTRMGRRLKTRVTVALASGEVGAE
jgi:hypothetical protein